MAVLRPNRGLGRGWNSVIAEVLKPQRWPEATLISVLKPVRAALLDTVPVTARAARYPHNHDYNQPEFTTIVKPLYFFLNEVII